MSEKKELDISLLDLEEAISRVRCTARKEIEKVKEAANLSIQRVNCSARKAIEDAKKNQE